MENKALLVTAAAPLSWGSGYYVTAHFLPPDRPLFGAAVRALPFGLLLLALRPGLLHGGWWWRTALLGLLNFGLFFALIFVAAYRLPGGLAATLTATSPLLIMVLAWVIAGDRPRSISLAAGVVGLAGVALLVVRGGVHVDGWGVLASLTAVASSSLGYVLVKVWRPPVGVVTFTAWQLVFGGLLLAPVAFAVEGTPPALGLREIGGFAYLGGIATVIAFVVWFRGLRELPAAAVALVGLLNPVSGTVIGVVLAGESFGPVRALGMVMVLGGVLLGQPAVIEAMRRRTSPC